MGCYAVLGGLSAVSLNGLFLTVVLIFLAGLAIKTAISARMQSPE